jgi:hypothetical protein
MNFPVPATGKFFRLDSVRRSSILASQKRLKGSSGKSVLVKVKEKGSFLSRWVDDGLFFGSRLTAGLFHAVMDG